MRTRSRTERAYQRQHWSVVIVPQNASLLESVLPRPQAVSHAAAEVAVLAAMLLYRLLYTTGSVLQRVW